MISELFITSVGLREELPKGCYLRDLAVVRSLREMGSLPITQRVTFLVGENGVGKSTLIEAIAVHQGFNPEGGTINFRFSTNDSHSELHNYLRITRGVGVRKDGFFLRAESFYNVASNIDELDAVPAFSPGIVESYGGVSLHRQSHGESFMALVANRFGGRGLYIFDEPEAALSPIRQMELLAHITRLVDDESRFVVSTHSPMLRPSPAPTCFR